ncbi:hypothetical protein CUMW_243430 [Citrus unshiu]|uniref:Uncharacterized protein n=1 Tax=Citrus unshiu TaxID=55188 RepID=A0A2H5QMA2_CITUN|nr:hypothetical protein CUMW_243430 [Citrus unshiu]
MEDEEKINSERSTKRFKSKTMKNNSFIAPINNLDDGCLMHVFSFLSPIPDQSVKDLSEPGVFPDLKTAVSVARPGDTILIAAGGSHPVSNIQIKKQLCLVGGGELPDETTLICSRGSDSALEFLSTCKLANLTVKAELGCCFLHRSGRLTIDGCVLQCMYRLIADYYSADDLVVHEELLLGIDFGLYHILCK